MDLHYALLQICGDLITYIHGYALRECRGRVGIFGPYYGPARFRADPEVKMKNPFVF